MSVLAPVSNTGEEFCDPVQTAQNVSIPLVCLSTWLWSITFNNSLYWNIGDDNDKIRKFHIFIVLDENFIFFRQQQNIAQSTDLGEYYLNMGLLFEIGSVVMEIWALEVEEKSQFSKISQKFSPNSYGKWWFCVHNDLKSHKTEISQNARSNSEAFYWIGCFIFCIDDLHRCF